MAQELLKAGGGVENWGWAKGSDLVGSLVTG